MILHTSFRVKSLCLLALAVGVGIGTFMGQKGAQHAFEKEAIAHLCAGYNIDSGALEWGNRMTMNGLSPHEH